MEQLTLSRKLSKLLHRCTGVKACTWTVALENLLDCTSRCLLTLLSLVCTHAFWLLKHHADRLQVRRGVGFQTYWCPQHFLLATLSAWLLQIPLQWVNLSPGQLHGAQAS